ncbi:MAG: glycosyltransferase family 9 protein [Elusimicrobiota bacterium]
MTRYLIVRTDRIGDVLLTTPVASALRASDPQAHIAFLVRSYAAPLLQNNPDIDETIVDAGGPVAPLIQQLKDGRYDVAIVAYPRWRVSWAVWRARIRRRIGPASKWYSLFFNERLWQHRSEGRRHEADYNLELLKPLGVPVKRVQTRIVLTEDEKQRAHQFLESLGVPFQKPVVILHPGSGNSSARWPLNSFMELGSRLLEEGYEVVVTGGRGENYQPIMMNQMRRVPVFVPSGGVSLRELAALLACANLVVTNSTGPLHIAVGLDVPTVSIYSSIATCHPRRWGPYPAWKEGNERHRVALAPDHGFPQEDITQVSVEMVLKMCQERLRQPFHAGAAN